MELLAQIFAYFGTVLAVLGLALKNQKAVIVLQGSANAALGVSYILLGPSRMSAGIISLIATVQTFVNFIFINKDKDPPKALVGIFFVLYAYGTALAAKLAGGFNFPLGFMPFIGAVLYLAATSTTLDMLTRLFLLTNAVVWVAYDALSRPFSLPNLITHTMCFAFAVLGIARVLLGRKKE